MSMFDSVQSIWQGHAAADELLKHGETTETGTEQSLYTLAGRLNVSDAEALVKETSAETCLRCENQNSTTSSFSSFIVGTHVWDDESFGPSEVSL